LEAAMTGLTGREIEGFHFRSAKGLSPCA
jgi:hypothetical protein